MCEKALRETSTGEAPWNIIDGSNHEYRSLTAGRLLMEALQRRLKGAAPVTAPAEPLPQPPEPIVEPVHSSRSIRASWSAGLKARRMSASTLRQAWMSQACCTAALGRLNPGLPAMTPSNWSA